MKFAIKINKPFSFVETMKTHGWLQLPPFYWSEEKQELKWILRIHDVLHVIKLQPLKEDESSTWVQCQADDPSTKNFIKQKFHYVMNLNCDLSEFYDLCRQDELLRKVPERGLGRIMRNESLFEDVFKSICATNVKWNQAVKMVRNIALLGDVASGTEFHIFPSPQQLLDAGEDFLKDSGRVGYRSSYLIDLAKRFVEGEPEAELAEAGEMSAVELKKYLFSFKGIGKTTAHYLMALYGHFEDMSVDSLVLNYMTTKHFDGVTPTEKQVVQFYEKYGRWRYLIYWMEFVINEGWDPND